MIKSIKVRTLTPLVYLGSYTCASIHINVWVWNGDKSTPDSTNDYQITYQNTTASMSHSININAIIQDYGILGDSYALDGYTINRR
jgi:hypothetical protein